MVGFRALSAGAVLFALVAAGSAHAAECPGKPDAIGTSRTLYVEPTEHIRLGMMQYSETLPLADHEVVLTFDDGPLAPYTTRVLDTLAAECVKATFFLVGRMAKSNPALVRRMYEAGHTVGTHSMSHPFNFHRMTPEQAELEVEGGIASVAAALGDRNKVAPFFRIPGLLRGETIERYLAGKSLMAWSADFPADDWLRISAKDIAARALHRIEARGRGMLLLHDIKPATVLALPVILRELKQRGYRIVHVEPASADHLKTVTRTAEWASRKATAKKGGAPGKAVAWPRPSLTIELLLAEPALPAPDPLSFGLGLASAAQSTVDLPEQPVSASSPDQTTSSNRLWPPVGEGESPTTIAYASEPVLPVPGPKSFGIGKDAVPIMPAEAATKRHAAKPGTPHLQQATAGRRHVAKPGAPHPQPAIAGRRHVAKPGAPHPQQATAGKRHVAKPGAPHPQQKSAGKGHTATPAPPQPPAAAKPPQRSGDTTSSTRPPEAAKRHVAEAGLLDFLFSPKPPGKQ